MKFKSVAVDGPSGAGKSTLAKLLAEALGYLYVDTGAIYRTVGLAAFRRGIAPTDREKVSAMLPSLKIALTHGPDGLQHMFLDGEDSPARDFGLRLRCLGHPRGAGLSAGASA